MDELHDIIQEWVSRHTRAEIEKIFGEYGQLYSPILKVSEVMKDPQVLHRNMIVDLEYRGLKYQDKGIPVKMSKTPGSIRRMPPTLGQHTDEVLESIGYTEKQLQALRESGAIR